MHSLFSDKPGTPAYILPATADAYEQMVEQVATTLIHVKPETRPAIHAEIQEQYRVGARAALRAIGITPPKKGQP